MIKVMGLLSGKSGGYNLINTFSRNKLVFVSNDQTHFITFQLMNNNELLEKFLKNKIVIFIALNYYL